MRTKKLPRQRKKKLIVNNATGAQGSRGVLFQSIPSEWSIGGASSKRRSGSSEECISFSPHSQKPPNFSQRNRIKTQNVKSTRANNLSLSARLRSISEEIGWNDIDYSRANGNKNSALKPRDGICALRSPIVSPNSSSGNSSVRIMPNISPLSFSSSNSSPWACSPKLSSSFVRTPNLPINIWPRLKEDLIERVGDSEPQKNQRLNKRAMVWPKVDISNVEKLGAKIQIRGITDAKDVSDTVPKYDMDILKRISLRHLLRTTLEQ